VPRTTFDRFGKGDHVELVQLLMLDTHTRWKEDYSQEHALVKSHRTLN